MPFPLVVFLLCLAAFLFKKWLANRRYGDFDGPSPLLSFPLIGHGHLLGKNPLETLTACQKKYGDVFRLDIGSEHTVFFCSHDLITEAFRKEVFAGRTFNKIPTISAIQPVGHDGKPVHGVINSEGPVWYEQRKFMLKILSNLGMGKKDTMEDVIEQEAEEVVARLKAFAKRPMQARGFFLNVTNNVAWRIITGKGTKQDDPELKELTQAVVEAFLDFDPSNLWGLLQISSLPFVRTLQFLGVKNYIDTCLPIINKLWAEVNDYEADPSGNYIERGLHEIEEDVAGDKNNLCLNGADGKKYLRSQLQDLFVAGTDTTSTMLEWMLLYLVKYPDVQERIFREVSSITGGNNRKVGLADREVAHYTNAFVDEVSRHCPMGALPPPHKVLEDTTFRGKFFPKDTQIIYYGYGINHEEKNFKDHDDFRPERFLDSDGVFHKDENMVLFGVGKRRCPGELLARAELFLFVASVVQNMRLRRAAGGKDLNFDYIPGIVFYPQEFEIVPEIRN